MAYKTHNPRWFIITALLSFLLFSITVSFAFCYSLTDASAPLLQAGYMPASPVIDGTIDTDEWAAAATTNTFHILRSESILFPTPVARIGFDRENLYIAITTPFPAGTKISAAQRVRDGQVYSDDAVEIFIDPKHNHGTDYQFVVNAVGSIADSKNADNSWNGKWDAKTSQTRTSWNLEMRIPFTTLGIDQINSRTVIGLNIGLDMMFAKNKYAVWAPLLQGGFHQPGMLGHISLDPAGPATSEMISVNRTSLDLNAATIPELPGCKVSFTVSLADKDLGKVNKDLNGNAGMSTDLPSQNGRIIDGQYRWNMDILRSNGGEIIGHHSGILDIKTAPPLLITLRKFFLQGKLAIDADSTGLEFIDKPLTFTAIISDSSGKQVDSKTITAESSRKATLNFDISGLPLTPHTVSVTVKDTAGNTLGTAKESFTRPEIPAWASTKAGKTDTVMPPWTPLKTLQTKTSIQISPWGRTYSFSNMPFPSSVITRGASILSGPVAIKLIVNGKSVMLSGKLHIVKKSSTQTVLQGTATGSNIKASSEVAIDYDGSAIMSLKLTASKALTVDRFTVEVPFKKKYAKYRYYFPGEWGSSQNVRALPASGWGSEFVPYVWLGDEDLGMAVYTTSDQYWNTDGKTNAVEARPAGSSTMALKFNVIVKPMALSADQKLNYTFGFEATPNRKPDKDAWDYRICASGIYGIDESMTGSQNSLTYKPGCIDPARGTLDMWVRLRFDPNAPILDYPARGKMNRDLFTINSPNETFCLYWNIDERGMRLYTQNGNEYPVMESTRCIWKENELHHLSITWGDNTCLYIDGRRVISVASKGLLGGTKTDTNITFTGRNPGFDIDEIRVSDIEREPEVPSGPYTADSHTLLLDHLDKLRNLGPGRITTIPEAGQKGIVSGSASLVEGKYGKALPTIGEKMLTLDYYKKLGVKTLILGEGWSEYQNYGETQNSQDKVRRLVKACHDRGIQIIPYMGYEMADICPEWDPYSNEMLVMPISGNYVREPKQTDRIVCYNSRWQDFIANSVANLIDKYDFDGVYLDGTAEPRKCMNTAHGCGYTRSDGTIASTYSFVGARNMMKRLYSIIKSKKPNGQINLHNSLTMIIPSIGWATSTWDGEQFGLIRSAVNMDELFPLESFRAEFMGRQWGVPAEMLCYEKPYTTHQAFSFSLLHDILVRGNGPGLEEESQIWKVMDKFGRKQADFRAYWNNSQFVKVSGIKTYASLYVRPGKGIMCIVSNLGKDTATVNVSLNLKKMKLGSKATAINALTGDAIPISNGKFNVELDSYDYTMVWIK